MLPWHTETWHFLIKQCLPLHRSSWKASLKRVVWYTFMTQDSIWITGCMSHDKPRAYLLSFKFSQSFFHSFNRQAVMWTNWKPSVIFTSGRLRICWRTPAKSARESRMLSVRADFPFMPKWKLLGSHFLQPPMQRVDLRVVTNTSITNQNLNPTRSWLYILWLLFLKKFFDQMPKWMNLNLLVFQCRPCCVADCGLPQLEVLSSDRINKTLRFRRQNPRLVSCSWAWLPEEQWPSWHITHPICISFQIKSGDQDLRYGCRLQTNVTMFTQFQLLFKQQNCHGLSHTERFGKINVQSLWKQFRS